MSRHPSFGKSIKSGVKRNVLKRQERLKVLQGLGKWDPEKNPSVRGLPKTPST
ncbi:MAG: small basic protein [Chlamydiia bacterium]|nr:small basic protein [Chlamydiia bacterium]